MLVILNFLQIITECSSSSNLTHRVCALMQVVALFTSYFNDFSEAAVRHNFVLIYELLDEVMDFGVPQITDPEGTP